MTNRNRLAFKKTDYEYRDLGELPIPLNTNTGLFTSPFVQMVGGKDSNDAVMPFKIDSTGRLDVIGVCPEHQADAELTQANPGSGDKYTVLDTTEYVRIIGMYARVNWTVQPTPLEIHGTIDGVSIIWATANPVNNDQYYAGINEGDANTQWPLGTTLYSPRRAFLLEGRSVKIEAETTGGTVSQLRARIVYAKW